VKEKKKKIFAIEFLLEPRKIYPECEK